MFPLRSTLYLAVLFVGFLRCNIQGLVRKIEASLGISWTQGFSERNQNVIQSLLDLWSGKLPPTVSAHSMELRGILDWPWSSRKSQEHLWGFYGPHQSAVLTWENLSKLSQKLLWTSYLSLCPPLQNNCPFSLLPSKFCACTYGPFKPGNMERRILGNVVSTSLCYRRERAQHTCGHCKADNRQSR